MVASFATITHSRPETRPMPQMMEALWTSPEYIPQAASWPISRNGEPGSSSVRTRSRGSILPRAVCLSRAAWSPPTLAAPTFSLRSATSVCMRSALARNSAERALTWLLMTLMVRSLFGERAADHQALDVVRPFVDLGDAHVAPQALDWEVRHVAVAAVDLDCIGADFLRHFRGEELRHRGFLDARSSGVAQARGVQIKLSRRFHLRRHIGEAEVDCLVLDQRLAHALAFGGVGERRLQGGARDAGRLRGDIDAPGFEIGEGDTVAHAFLPQEVLDGDAAVLE